MLPSKKEILKHCRTEGGRDNLISDFRTDRTNLSIEEAVLLKIQLDEDVAQFVSKVESLYDSTDDYNLEDDLFELKNAIVASYGYDGFDDGVWVQSNY